MKLYIVVSAMLLLIGTEAANAACTGPQVTDAALSTLLSGKTACASRGADQWQEEHHAGGVLKDFKKGPSDPIDPTKTVGSWAVAGNGNNTAVQYSYTGDGSYSYTVHTIDTVAGTYSFCGTAGTTDNIDLTLKPGTGVGCGF